MKHLHTAFSFLLTVVLMGTLQPLKASHITGAGLNYSCQNGCIYTIYQTTFMDCGSPLTPMPPGTPPPPTVNFTGNGTSCGTPLPVSNWVLDSYTEISPICPTLATNCTNASSTILGQMEAVYKRDYNFCVANACTSYDITWSTCCRNSIISSGGANTSIFLKSHIDLSVSPCNNSPVFTSPPVVNICTNTGAIMSQHAYDRDGDSLIYSLIACGNNATSSISYNAGFSPTAPLGPGWSVTLNGITGELSVLPTGTSGPIVAGIVCIQVDEFRNGLKIGDVQREIQLVALNCGSTNQLPVADTAYVVSGGSTIANWHFRMCQADTLRFELTSHDPDAMQSLTYELPQHIPGLSMTSTGTNPLSATISFAPGASGYFTLPIRIMDNTCAVRGISVQNIFVSVGNACLTAVVTDASCGAAAGAIDLTVNGGTAPLTYAWSNGATTEDITGLFPGSYSVTVTDANGLIFNKSFIVNASNIVVNSTVVQPSCNTNGSISLAPSGGSAPYTYSWSNGQTTSSITNLVPGGYSVVVKDSNDCPKHVAFVLNQPDSCFNVVAGIVFDDTNGNCILDPGESTMPNRLINFTPGGATLTDANGAYSYRLATGSFTIETPIGRWQQLSCPSAGSHAVSFANVGNVQSNLDFAIETDSVQELGVSYYQQRVKVGDTTYHYLRVWNNGNTTMSGTLNWVHDSLFTVENSVPAASYNATTRTASWNFFNLNPYQSLVYRVYTSTDSTTPLGVWFSNTATVLPIVGDSIPSNNTATRSDTTRGPYDPNDKLVTPAGMGPLGLIEQSEQEMNYTVRFQNTGTDTAYYVIIRDTIDIQHLDILSFQADNQSFPYSLNIENDEILVFRFDNINLPDSTTDFNGSQGFVSFKLRHKGTLPIGSQIRNRAAIYFDFNPPIITNTVLNTVFAYPELDLGADTTICEGEPIFTQITSPGLPPYDFHWSDGTTDNGNTSGISHTRVQSSGTYKVVVTDYLGISAEVQVQVTAAPLADANFNIAPVGLTVGFNTLNPVNSSWQWDFGDGNTAIGNPTQVHTYAESKLYTVTLITTNDCGSDTIQQEVDLRGVGIEDELFARSVTIQPHPVEEVSYLRFANVEGAEYRLRIFNLQGQLVKDMGTTRKDVFSIEKENFPAGVYLFELKGMSQIYGKMIFR